MNRALQFAGAGAILASVHADAHLVSTRFGELYSGLLHPLLALEHVLPWLGLGLLGALAGRHCARFALLVFPVCVFVGFMAAAFLPASDVVRAVNLGSLVVLGGLIAANARLPASVFVALTGLVGLTHGFGNGAAQLAGSALLLYAAGVTLAAYLIVVLTTAGAWALVSRALWGRVAVRAAGSWMVAIGIVYGGFAALAGS